MSMKRVVWLQDLVFGGKLRKKALSDDLTMTLVILNV